MKSFILRYALKWEHPNRHNYDCKNFTRWNVSGIKSADNEVISTKQTDFNETLFPTDVHNSFCADTFRAGTQL